MAKNYSFPKERLKVLLLENIHSSALPIFEEEKYQIKVLNAALTEDELIKELADVSILGIRSNTSLTAKVFDAAPRLLVVGAFCIGTNQIDLDAAASHGVAVFNAPFSNTRSVVELAVANMIALNRHLTDKNKSMHDGVWDKSAAGNHEVRGRKLGIVGYGNIGTQFSVIAEALGMEVYYYDVNDKLTYGNAKRCDSLAQLLSTVDVVTSHVDGRTENKNLFGAKEFAAMKPGSLFLNLSRGMVVEEAALVAALKSGHLAGAAVDVFDSEPKKKGEPFKSALRGLPNVILTPHIASGTEEAQQNIGIFVANKLVKFINTGSTALGVNLPSLSLPKLVESHRLIWVHTNTPGTLAKFNNLLANENVNIDAQFLGTKGATGYVITDVNTNYNTDVIKQIRAFSETIRLRILY